jgi:hypothetical protein
MASDDSTMISMIILVLLEFAFTAHSVKLLDGDQSAVG